MAEQTRPLCQQIESISVADCCGGTPERQCSAVATWLHTTGAALCDVHERSARLHGGTTLGWWFVGRDQVPYPDGWGRIGEQPEPSDEPVEEHVQLEIVTFDS